MTSKNTDSIKKTANSHLRLISSTNLDEAAPYFPTLIQTATWFSTPEKVERSTLNTPLYTRMLVVEKGGLEESGKGRVV